MAAYSRGIFHFLRRRVLKAVMSPEGIMEGGCDENSPIDDDLHIRTYRAVPGSSSLMVVCDEVFRRIIYLEGRRIYVGSWRLGRDMCRLLVLGADIEVGGLETCRLLSSFRQSPMAEV